MLEGVRCKVQSAKCKVQSANWRLSFVMEDMLIPKPSGKFTDWICKEIIEIGRFPFVMEDMLLQTPVSEKKNMNRLSKRKSRVV